MQKDESEKFTSKIENLEKECEKGSYALMHVRKSFTEVEEAKVLQDKLH